MCCNYRDSRDFFFEKTRFLTKENFGSIRKKQAKTWENTQYIVFYNDYNVYI